MEAINELRLVIRHIQKGNWKDLNKHVRSGLYDEYYYTEIPPPPIKFSEGFLCGFADRYLQYERLHEKVKASIQTAPPSIFQTIKSLLSDTENLLADWHNHLEQYPCETEIPSNFFKSTHIFLEKVRIGLSDIVEYSIIQSEVKNKEDQKYSGFTLLKTKEELKILWDKGNGNLFRCEWDSFSDILSGEKVNPSDNSRIKWLLKAKNHHTNKRSIIYFFERLRDLNVISYSKKDTPKIITATCFDHKGNPLKNVDQSFKDYKDTCDSKDMIDGIIKEVFPGSCPK